MVSSTPDHSRVHVVQMARHEERRRGMGAFWQVGFWNVTTCIWMALCLEELAVVVSEHSQHCQDSFLGIHEILGMWQLWWWCFGVYPTAVIVVIIRVWDRLIFGALKNNGNIVFCLNIPPKCLPEFGGQLPSCLVCIWWWWWIGGHQSHCLLGWKFTRQPW